MGTFCLPINGLVMRVLQHFYEIYEIFVNLWIFCDILDNMGNFSAIYGFAIWSWYVALVMSVINIMEALGISSRVVWMHTREQWKESPGNFIQNSLPNF